MDNDEKDGGNPRFWDCIPTTPPTVFDKPETVLPRMPVTVLAAPVTPVLLSLFILIDGIDILLTRSFALRYRR